jgi:fibronectin-binding autotransporter adhesin
METHTLAVRLETRKNTRYQILLVALIALFFCPLSAFAQCTISWSGGASGSWDTAGNWTPAGPPSGSSNTCITTANSSVTINGGDATDNLTLGATDSLGLGAGETLTVGGNISNAGTINLSTPSYGIQLILNGTTTLSGAGTITLGNGNGNEIDGSGTLTNQSTIQGGGYIGGGTLTLDNAGLIDANNGFSMEIQTAGTLTNTSTIEATAAASLDIYDSTVNNAGGTILASGTNSAVTLNGTSVTGGTLTSSSGGVIYGENSASLSNLTISTGTTFEMAAGQTVNLNGTITNNGNIFLNTASYGITLNIASNTTLTGGGSVTMSNDGGNNISTGTPGTTLTNVNNTISGVGNIGNGSGLNIINDASGIIDANVSGGTLYIVPSNGGSTPMGTTTNLGTLEASNGGILTVEDTVTNTGGTIQALTGSTVNLYADVIGGNLATSGTGVIDSYGATLDGTSTHPVTITSGSTVQLLAGETMYLEGSIVNDGIIFGNTSSYGTTLQFVANTTLSGGGKVTMSNDGSNTIDTNTAGTTLTNMNNTISGVGNIGGGSGLNIVNQGTINANVSGGTLTIEPYNGTVGTTTNTGTMEASNGGILLIEDAVTNTGGVILATGTGSQVTLYGATIIGGTLTSSSGGAFYAQNDPLLNGVTISTGSSIDIQSGQTLTLEGTITNKGTINVESTSYGSTLYIDGNVTLTAPGKVILGITGPNYIDGNGGTLTNQGTIEGRGNIGNGDIALVNSGSILANEPSKDTPSTLYIDTDSAGFTNNVGTKNGILNVLAKNTLIIEGGALNNFNSSTDTLTGGEYLVAGTLEFAGADIVVNDATITLTGASAKILNSSNSANALTGFDDNGTKGVFTVNSATFTDANAFTNSGTLAVGSGGKFNASTQLTNFNSTTSTLTGGTYTLTATGQLEFNNQGDTSDIVTNDAKITLAGVDTTKSSIIDQTGANALANFAANGSTGSLTITTDRNYSTPGNFTNAGTVDITKSTGTGHTQLTIGSTGSSNYTQTGGTTTVDGLLTTTGAINIQGGFLYGNAGTLTGALDLTGGILSPGDGLKKLGDLTVSGSFTEGSSGDLTIDLDGTVANTKYDVLNIDGAAALGGTLTIDLVGTYKPVAGNVFDIVNYSSETGTFANLVLPTITGDHWTVSYNSTGIVLTLVAGPGPNVYGDDLTPAPGSVSGTPARRTSRSEAFGAISGTPARWTRSTSPITSGGVFTHEPSAILTPAVTCGGFHTFASMSCITRAFSGVAANIGSGIRTARSERTTAIGTLHNNVAASISGPAGRAGAPHAPDARTLSAASLARVYVCAYLPSEVASTMGCR